MKLETGVTYILKYIESDIEAVVLYLYQHYGQERILETEKYYDRDVESVISDKRLFVREEHGFVPLSYTHLNSIERMIDETQFYRRIFIEIKHD